MKQSEQHTIIRDTLEELVRNYKATDEPHIKRDIDNIAFQYLNTVVPTLQLLERYVRFYVSLKLSGEFDDDYDNVA